MNEPNADLIDLLELVKQDMDSYTWTIGTGPPPTQDRWGNRFRENGQPVTEEFPDDTSWVWADPPVEGFVGRTNAKDLVGPVLMAHPMRDRITEMLSAGDFKARVMLDDPETATDADPAVQFIVEHDDELISLLRLPATELGWRMPPDPELET
jgi:hypothetical protein